MSGLTDRQVATIGRLGFYLPAGAEQLAPFEQELLVEVLRRYRSLGRNAVVTDAEWRVVEDALHAMSGSLA